MSAVPAAAPDISVRPSPRITGSSSRTASPNTTAAAVVDAIVAPIFAYLRGHPDILLLNTAPEAASGFGKRREELKHAGLDIIERILAARSPSARPEVRRARAAVMVGTIEGVTIHLTRTRPTPSRVVKEVTRAMTAYLEAVDRLR